MITAAAGYALIWPCGSLFFLLLSHARLEMPPTRSPPARSPQQWPRGPDNDLQHAAYGGFTKRTIALLESGRFDVNQGNLEGFTPLICAARKGHSSIVRTLLDKGANQSIANSSGFTALHVSCQHGHIAVAKILVGAGAHLEATTTVGSTPLHQAAENGHPSVIKMLTEAGADVNSRRWAPRTAGPTFGETPLHLAANRGHVSATRELLLAKANAQLFMENPDTGGDVPLEMAAFGGHSGVVRELILQRGIEGCGGASGGVEALGVAAVGPHMEIMAMLTNAGVVDTGAALARAAAQGREAPVAFLLEYQSQKASGGRVRYVNAGRIREPRRPLFCSIEGCSPRVVRLLIDAGADTTASYSVLDMQRGGEVVSRLTALALVDQYLCDKTAAGGRDLTEKDLQGLEAIRRLLMQVDAVYAVSWLWHHTAPSVFGRAAECAGSINTTPVAIGTPLTMMLPVLRRRAARRGMALPALFRWVMKARCARMSFRVVAFIRAVYVTAAPVACYSCCFMFSRPLCRIRWWPVLVLLPRTVLDM